MTETSVSSGLSAEDRMPTREQLHQLYRDYCLSQFVYGKPAYADEAARQAHIEYDARSYYEEAHMGPLAELVEAAFRLGRESMMPKPKPPVVYVLPRGVCAVCGKELTVNADGRVRGHDKPKVKGERWAGRCPGGRKPAKAVS